MSKGKVWNRGKHNGGGLAGVRKGKMQAEEAAKSGTPSQPIVSAPVIDPNNPVNVVKRMNRDNWVSRPIRNAGKAPDKKE